jgi:hypothetical protein
MGSLGTECSSHDRAERLGVRKPAIRWLFLIYPLNHPLQLTESLILLFPINKMGTRIPTSQNCFAIQMEQNMRGFSKY